MTRTRKYLLVALVASLAMHWLLLFSFPGFEWPKWPRQDQPIEAVLQPLPKPFKPIAPPRPVARRVAAKPRTAAEALPAPPQQHQATPEIPAASQPAAQPAPLPVPEQPAPPPVDLPRHVELIFQVEKGDAGLAAGRAVHQFDISDDGHYTIHGTIGAVGLFSLFYSGNVTQTSRGTVTAQGLRPDLYTIVRGSEQSARKAIFDWNSMTLELEAGGEKKQVKLLPATQDELSFIYQFAYSHPVSGVFRFTGTDGKKIDEYQYQNLGAEEVLTPAGRMAALHLRKVHQPGSDGTDIWLSTDNYYWPVKIELTDKQGGSIVLVIKEIIKK